jgi:hypothetical protein
VASRAGTWIIGGYAWLSAVLTGAILADIVVVTGDDQASRDAADVLLLLWGLTVLAGLGALVSAWTRPRPATLLLVSLGLVGAEVVVAVVLGPVVGDLESTIGVRIGAWLRLGASAAASLAAFAGWWASGRGPAGERD